MFGDNNASRHHDDETANAQRIAIKLSSSFIYRVEMILKDFILATQEFSSWACSLSSARGYAA